MKYESYLSSKEKNVVFFPAYKQIYDSVSSLSKPSNN